MKNIFEIFNNREIATAIWICIISIVFLFKSEIRKSVVNLLKIFFYWKIQLFMFSLIIYSLIIISLLYLIKFWTFDFLKDSIIWFCFTGIVLSFDTATKSKYKSLFKKIIFDNIKVLIILEFIINTYTFSLIGEIIFLPIITFIAMIEVVSKFNNKYSPVEKLTNYIQIVIGIIILTLSIIKIITDFKNFGNLNTLRSFLLPPFLSISILPFIYLMIIISHYEQLFLRLNFYKTKNKKLINYAKKKIFRNCLLSLRKTNKALNMNIYNLMHINTYEDVDEMEKIYKKEL